MEGKRITASKIYDLLLNEFKIKEQIGSIEIKLGGISAKYSGKDAIGDLLQEWLREWLILNNFYFRQPKNTQAFPDFLLSESDNSNFLELKAFDADASPAFDIANFDSYCTSLLLVPERIEADYLIFSYKMVDSVLSIDNVWLKKVWEITSLTKKNTITLQQKRGLIYNIRPCTWYSSNSKNPPFKDKVEFLNALVGTFNSYNQCANYKTNWLKNVEAKYLQNTGIKL